MKHEKNQLIQQTFFILFYNMSKWRMKEQPSPFIICSAMLQDLQWPFKLKKKKKKSCTKKGNCPSLKSWLSRIFPCAWFTMNWWLLTKRRPWLWGSTKWEHGNIQTKRCFSSAFCSEKLLSSKHCINSISLMTKQHLDF